MRTVVTKSGKEITLLNPREKAERFARQLKNNAIEETGEVLTPAERSYRAGYLAARRDSADAYNAVNDPDKLKANKKKRAEARKEAQKRKRGSSRNLPAIYYEED